VRDNLGTDVPRISPRSTRTTRCATCHRHRRRPWPGAAGSPGRRAAVRVHRQRPRRRRGRHHQQGQRGDRIGFGVVVQAGVGQAHPQVPVGLWATGPDVRSAAASRWLVVVLPFVPVTTTIRRPTASADNAPGSSSRVTRPPMIEPAPNPTRRDTRLATSPACTAATAGIPEPLVRVRTPRSAAATGELTSSTTSIRPGPRDPQGQQSSRAGSRVRGSRRSIAGSPWADQTTFQ
jgi:hypothetical protein